ncbi:hypothetical protein AURDEDRAFT_177770 [Auricularia subglabra TFB-10046 SS5]|uniref:Uncharacterized protein n=1 Tax=Auricularia subglabra (strain TFB-10046 / SS5) TaxID=717982 RepID=J0L9T9_AURST|nr:hypothetical protein AURDEDRAFT_177770 [Auricularia subglabra TFB-10046 SS5]
MLATDTSTAGGGVSSRPWLTDLPPRVWTASPVRCSLSISQPPRPRANLVLRHPPQGRAASSAPHDRIPAASVSIIKLRTDPFRPRRARDRSHAQKPRSAPAAESACQSAVPPVPPSPHHPAREQAMLRGDPARWGSVMRPVASAASGLRRERPETSRRDVKRCPAALEGWSSPSAPTVMVLVIPSLVIAYTVVHSLYPVPNIVFFEQHVPGVEYPIGIPCLVYLFLLTCT